MWVWSLAWEDLLEEDMATHSNNSCLENPMDRGAWWAAVHRVAQSQTWLKWLSMQREEIPPPPSPVSLIGQLLLAVSAHVNPRPPPCHSTTYRQFTVSPVPCMKLFQGVRATGRWSKGRRFHELAGAFSGSLLKPNRVISVRKHKAGFKTSSSDLPKFTVESEI